MIYAYCTDTNYNAMAALNQELKTLNVAFSSLDIIKVMGQNSADFIDRGKDLGTIQPAGLPTSWCSGAIPSWATGTS